MSAGRRWARRLLALYPPSFRRRFGDEFTRDLAADWAEVSARRRRVRWRRRIGLVAGAVGLGLLERLGATTRAIAARLPDGSGLASGLALDIRAAARALWRSPGFTATAVVTLAAGIGINATAFTLIDVVLLRDLPYPQADRLVAVRIARHDGKVWPGLTFGELQQLEARTDLFAAVGGIRPNYAEVLTMELDVTGVERPEKLQGMEVTPGLFATLGIEPVVGRALAAEDRDGHDGQALGYMVSHEYWTRALGADADVVGRTLTIEHRDKTIVGVLPPEVRLYFDANRDVPARSDLWTRMYHNVDSPDTRYVRVIARLQEGVAMEQARAALQTMVAGWYGEWPDHYGEAPGVITIKPLKAQLTDAVRPLLTALALAVGLVLVLACTNVGSLILARSRAREAELGVRRALGASRVRIGRMLMTESILLGLVGAAGGVALTAFSTGAVRRLAGSVLPRGGDLQPGAETVVVAVALAIVAGLFAGALAVVQLRGRETVTQLRQGARLAGSRRAGRYRNTLTVVQTAAAVVLLVGAGLMVRTLANLAAIDLGFQPAGVLTFKVEIDQTQIALGPPRYEFFRDIAAAVGNQPEFESASAIFVLPTHGGFASDSYGRSREEMDTGEHMASFNVVLPGYFETMRIPLLQGEDFRPEWPDHDFGEVIVDDRIAEIFWPGEDIVGRTLWIEFDTQNPDIRDSLEARIVGVAAHANQDSVRDASVPQIYVPHWHRPFWGMNFVGRLRDSNTDLAAMATATAAAQRVVDADPDAIFMHSERPLAEVVAEDSRDGLLLSRMLGLFSGLALLLSATGLYGVISYGARQRTREVGIRMATGAQRRDVAWLIVRGALRISGLGVALGIVAAFGVSRVLEGLLFGVAADDPTTYGIVALVLFGVGVLAAICPATRAATIDPVQALRSE